MECGTNLRNTFSRLATGIDSYNLSMLLFRQLRPAVYNRHVGRRDRHHHKG